MATPNLGTSIRKIWQESDGRALLERAFAADPERTGLELTYLGAEDVAGDLKLQAESRAKSGPG